MQESGERLDKFHLLSESSPRACGGLLPVSFLLPLLVPNSATYLLSDRRGFFRLIKAIYLQCTPNFREFVPEVEQKFGIAGEMLQQFESTRRFFNARHIADHVDKLAGLQACVRCPKK